MKPKLLTAFGLVVAIWVWSCQKPGIPSQYLISKIDYDFLNNMTNMLNNQLYIQSYVQDSTNGRYPNGVLYNIDLEGYNYPSYREHKPERAAIGQMVSTYTNTTPGSQPDASHVALLNQLKSVSGRAFDSIYITSQIKDHNNIVDLYTTEANFGVNDSIRHMAVIYLSTELQHQQNAIFWQTRLLP